MNTIDQVCRDFDIYVASWHQNRDKIPAAFKSSIITQIIRTGSIDTTRFIRSVDFREESLSGLGYRFLIDSSRDSQVYYDGYLEFDGVTRHFVGRFNYRDGIENTDLEPISDEIADSSFAR